MRHLSNYIYTLKRFPRDFPRDISYLLGSKKSFFEKARGARILVYHGVCLKNHLKFNTIFVTKKMFESQLRFYKKYFHIVSLEEFYHKKFESDRFNICLSFDDGFANNFTYVLPLLEQYEVPASFFITGIREAGYDFLWNDCLSIAYKYGPARFVFGNEEFLKDKNDKYRSTNSGNLLADIVHAKEFEAKEELIELLGKYREQAPHDYWLQMSVEQIRQMSENKSVTIGSHGYYHNDLAQLSVSSLKKELVDSKQFLERITGREVSALAFPYGSYDSKVVSEAKAAGYKQLLTTDFLSLDDSIDPLLKERLTINPFISLVNQMHAIITGKY